MSTPLSFIDSYKKTIKSYDEVIDKNGQVKPHWATLFQTLEAVGMEELSIRNKEIVNKLKENGVTYNVYDSETGLVRPWKLDPIPFVIHQTEWETVEKGLIQRAKLLDLIYKDIYGEQLLIKNNIIPAELVFDNTGFLRPCFDINQKDFHQLTILACDIARGPDGKMWLLDNRVQSPSGTGYALENRIVMANIFPKLNKNIHRSKLGPYFNELQKTVGKFGSNSDNPNVVFLSPGEGNETYFEHVYLSSYLGYNLVEGSDLLVREGYVWLKTIDQLERVDVIIKRVDDLWCDPLELNSNSLLGIPGLLQVMRLGNVTVINPPGIAVLENHGLMAFIQNACKFLLKEPLIMNSTATWWCGQTKELNFVLNNLPKLIIKKTNRNLGVKSIYGRKLNESELVELKAKILKSPKDFVAQEEVSLSTTPSLIDGEIVPRLAVIRAFLVSDGKDYKVMQGGLTRSSVIEDKFQISNQFGGISKDTWIITDGLKEQLDQQEQQDQIIEVKKNNHVSHNAVLTSRNAENLFWVGRLSERTMVLTGFLKIIFSRLNENVSTHGKKQPEFLIVLLKALTHLTQSYPGFVGKEGVEDETVFDKPLAELISLIKDPKKEGSVSYNVQSLLYSINHISEKWNQDTKRIISLIEDSLTGLKEANASSISRTTHSLDKLYIRMMAFYGNTYETLPRENGFFLFEAGKNIERFLSLTSVIQSLFCFKRSEDVEQLLLESVLENHNLLAQYRSIYKSQISLITVINMLFLEKNSPYTLAYILDTLSYNIAQLPKKSELNQLSIAEKKVLEANTIIKLIDPEELVTADEANYRKALDETINSVSNLLSTVTNSLSSLYFNHSVMQLSFLETEKIDSDEV
ncbi:circularly permuted type 2 ATP-grasp protein [Flavobacterium algicola]|uniref:circularly permuted type 2 ATP-grasp protein n=1 Tax=Flavobacterium algicola TaxID=556529 RepID=UPI001EFDA3AB|nr:circularly permuted type 2 ATP-grasp protein [Flavobacterium algicola]MCG9791344.1 circularly permuted type 2 ATP-grasp protein [Flavobacterium algicola]